MPFDGSDWKDQSELSLLRAARAGVAAPGGWCSGILQTGGAHCAVGWLIQTLGGSPHRAIAQASLLAAKHLYPELPAAARRPAISQSPYPSLFWKVRAITRFNDRNDQATVVALFDRAIAKLEEQECRSMAQ